MSSIGSLVSGTPLHPVAAHRPVEPAVPVRTAPEGAAAEGTADAIADAQPAPSPLARAKGIGLSHQELAQVDELKTRDREVRQHEQAHKTVGGPYAGAIRYDFVKGPDGLRYAAGGEVPIDVSPVQGDPEATIAKMEIVKAAALAPAEPSAQDRAVAQTADAQISAAEAELHKVQNDALRGENDGEASGSVLQNPYDAYNVDQNDARLKRLV